MVNNWIFTDSTCSLLLGEISGKLFTRINGRILGAW